ncbi:integrator complex subunit 10-like [Saccoglossus kowalevskii]|uniref:Integrator complex subunit 10 n=1 Tax=Saccoglossus kowalevskii TaxID=10224 RepID=A0ABM0GTY5_SACKO|nr:PREDICTED: integrator complex subunit 10-like [Saccoglossus kowalevskii]
MAAFGGADQKWLVDTAQSLLLKDPAAAKAWLLTARALFPRDFGIQYHSYCIAKSSPNLKEAAKLLYELFIHFHHESTLWQEFHCITIAMQSDLSDPHTTFLSELFESLPSQAQHDILLQVAEHTKDLLSHCKLQLLLISKFRNAVITHGVKLVETLLSAEKMQAERNPLNCFRKLLVCDVLPILLSIPDVPCSNKQLAKWLQKSIEFYICYAVRPRSADNKCATPGFKSPLKSPDPSTSRFVFIEGLTEKESTIVTPWANLHNILLLTSSRLGWNTDNVVPTDRNHRQQWLYLSRVYKACQKMSDENRIQHIKPVFYSLIVLLFQCLHGYLKYKDPEQFAVNSSPSAQHGTLVLLHNVEVATKKKKDKHEHKRARLLDKDDITETSKEHISVWGMNKDKSELLESFTTAVICWQLIQSDEVFDKDFKWLLHYWKSIKWTWLTSFQIDMGVYTGDTAKSLVMLEERHESGEIQGQLEACLQLSSCFLAMKHYQKACDMALDAVAMLPDSDFSTVKSLGHEDSKSNSLQFVCCASMYVLQYCIKLILMCFKKIFNSGGMNEIALGHMLVMMQYDWPKEEKTFRQVIDVIMQQGTFTYTMFFKYVINIDILEEVSFLRTDDGGKVELELLVQAPSQHRQRTVTRGLTKGGEEGLKVAMEKQMTRYDDNLLCLIKQFLTEERGGIRQAMVL